MKNSFLRTTLFICFIAAHMCRAQTPIFTLYGMTVQGGSNQDGTLFQWPIGGGLFQSDHDFSAGGDGASPWGSPVLASNGLIYGVTKGGGTGLGVIFSFNPVNNAVKVVHTFTAGDAEAPWGSLIQATNGLLYGLATSGGAGNLGAIFSFNPVDSSEHVLYSFAGGTGDGEYGYGALMQAKDTLLYGMTQRGGTNDSGIIFSYNISTGIETKLHDFGNDSDAAYPSGSLMQASNGLLYGMSYAGGSSNRGAIFSYNIATGRDSVLHSFAIDTLNGLYPYGSLIQGTDGLLYGLTTGGGRKYDGMMFSYNISTGAYVDLHDFGSVSGDGVRPEGTLLQATDGNLYGMTTAGGSVTDGTVFSYNPTNTSYNFLSFTGFNGYLPYYGAMIEYGNSTAPVLLHSPSSVITCANDSAVFTVTASGPGLTYQWQVSTDSGNTYTNINGATGSVYTVLATAAQSGYFYWAIVSNTGGADTTLPVSLTVTPVSKTATAAAAVCTATQTGGTYQWLNCGTGLPVSGATSQAYNATANGSYSCIVTVNGCTDTTNCVAVTSLGINDIPAYSFSLYPNPFTGQVKITLAQQNIQQATITITNILGQVIYTQREGNLNAGYTKTLDLSNLPTGVYLVDVVVNGVRTVRQLVKQ